MKYGSPFRATKACTKFLTRGRSAAWTDDLASKKGEATSGSNRGRPECLGDQDQGEGCFGHLLQRKRFCGLTFIGPRPKRHDIDHVNGDRQDNRL